MDPVLDVCVREPIKNPVLDVCVREPIMDPVLDVCVREPIMEHFFCRWGVEKLVVESGISFLGSGHVCVCDSVCV